MIFFFSIPTYRSLKTEILLKKMNCSSSKCLIKALSTVRYAQVIGFINYSTYPYGFIIYYVQYCKRMRQPFNWYASRRF